MSKEELKKEISTFLNELLETDFKKLYPNSINVQLWNNLDGKDIENFIVQLKKDLIFLSSDIALIDKIAPDKVALIRDHLRNTVSQLSSLKDIKLDQITNQHHGSLNRLNSLKEVLQNSGLHTEIRIEKILKENIPNLKSVESIAKNLLDSSEKIDDSIKQANDWLKVRRDIHNKTINEQAEAFYDMAQGHRVFRGWASDDKNSVRFRKGIKFFRGFRGSWVWMAFTLVFATLTAGVTYFFIVKESVNGTDVSTGAALLRIASLVVPAYLTLFCANQFLYHKRMYDNYMFKYSSLNTMNNLISTHEKERGNTILEKGLGVLFSEPRTKERGGKYDHQLVNELVKMLHEQIRN